MEFNSRVIKSILLERAKIKVLCMYLIQLHKQDFNFDNILSSSDIMKIFGSNGRKGHFITNPSD